MSATGDPHAHIYVESARIRNFRGLSDCSLELEPSLTLLVGRNNAGKSRVLRAIGIALGGIVVELDDLTVGSQDPGIIDIVLAPPPPTEDGAEEVFDSEIGQRLGPAVQAIQEEPLRERVAWRTTIRTSAEGMGARSDAQQLIYDSNAQDWVLQTNAPGLSRDQRLLFSADFVDTRRDLVEELARRGSAVRRVLSDLEVDNQKRKDLETKLAELSSAIVISSSTLAAVKTSLQELESVVGDIGVPALSPLPARLEELARSVAIDLDTGSGALPVRLHGLGARSLASLQIQGVLYRRRLGQDGPAIRPHPVTLVEEPEAHLHPQAAMELGGLLARITGQVIASTHSAHLVTAVEPRAIRLIRQEAEASIVVDLGPAKDDSPGIHRALRPGTHASEMEKLKRLVERPFGELLFASAIVIGDGATERAFLPVVLRHALGTRAQGVCVIDPGSMNSELAVAAIKFARLVAIPWLLFSDSDGPGKQNAETLIKDFADGDEGRVVWVGSTNDETKAAEGATEKMLIEFDEEMCREACHELRPDIDCSGSVLGLLKQLKGTVGAVLARKLIEKQSDHANWPAPVRSLIKKLQDVLPQ